MSEPKNFLENSRFKAIALIDQETLNHESEVDILKSQRNANLT